MVTLFAGGAMRTLTTGMLAIALMLPSEAISQEAEGARLPEKARVTYRGTAKARITEKVRVPRRLSLRSAIESVANRDVREFDSAVTYELTFDGASVTGVFTGTGGAQTTTLSGTYRDGYCRLMDPKGSEVTEGRCDATGFSGRLSSTSVNRYDLSGSFATTAVKIVDVVAEQQRLQRERAERAAAYKAQQERLIARAYGKGSIADRLDAIVTLDAQKWMFNKYEAGSIQGVQTITGGPTATNWTVRATYRYNGGMPGWVKAKVSGGSFACLEFHDFAGECRPVGQPSSHRVAMQAAMEAMMSPPASGGEGDNRHRCYMIDYKLHNCD